MDSPAFERLRRIVLEAAQAPAEERPAILARECGEDDELRAAASRLVARDFGEPSLDHPGRRSEAIGELTGARTVLRSTLRTDDIIGPYHLLELIGEGGMGEVWRAEQTRPMRREVALKVIKAGLDTRHVVARFEAERQALALMDHPAIAKVHDAGETPRGLPYFAMEYVAGVPVTEYSDRNRLRTRDRLDLFARICEGVQHAHEKGVIHRDLKPSNVLVTLRGDRPVPKIIDFGIAKATASRLTERTLFTELGVMIGTPSYMSPEQADPAGLDVDTRTDVYALGVMLYELLTGVLPFDARALREAGYDEIRRRIREVDPPRPSTRAGTLEKEESTEIARRRGTVPSRLVSRLRGDLDWIVMKCLEKDRARRYASPNELAADLRRHLADEPVTAGAPGATYRVGKFVRRHRVGVGITAAAVIGLAAFTGSTIAQNRRIAAEIERADREAEVSQRVTDFMTGMFEVADPGESRGNTVTVHEMLDRGAERIGEELDDEPEVKARLLLTMGVAYKGLGAYPKAAELTEEALRIRQRTLGPEDPRTLRTANRLAQVWDRLGRYEEAEKLLRETLEAQRRTLGEDHPDTLHSLQWLAAMLERQGRDVEAGPLYRATLDGRRRVLDENDPRLLWAIEDVGWHLVRMGNPEEGEPMLREAAEGLQRVLGEDHPDVLWVRGNLANCLLKLGRNEEAETLAREVFEARSRVFGPDHPLTLSSQQLHANSLYRLGRPEEAEAVYRKVAEARGRVLGPKDKATRSSLGMVAAMLTEEGKHAEAESLMLGILEIQRKEVGPEDESTLTMEFNLGMSYFGSGRLDGAERQFRRVHEIALRAFGESNELAASAAYALACVAARNGRKEEGLEWLRNASRGGYGIFRNADIDEDEDLESLHGNPEFERIVAEANRTRTEER